MEFITKFPDFPEAQIKIPWSRRPANRSAVSNEVCDQTSLETI